jgi:hypothetical protein
MDSGENIGMKKRNCWLLLWDWHPNPDDRAKRQKDLMAGNPVAGVLPSSHSSRQVIEILKPMVVSHGNFAAEDILREFGKRARRENPNPPDADRDSIDYKPSIVVHHPRIRQFPDEVTCTLYGSHGVSLRAIRAYNLTVHKADSEDILEWENASGVPCRRKLPKCEQ